MPPSNPGWRRPRPATCRVCRTIPTPPPPAPPGALRVDPVLPRAWLGREPIDLPQREWSLLDLLVRQGLTDLPALRVLEVGCGAGDNLRELIGMGFAPANLAGIELLPDRLALARGARVGRALAGEVLNEMGGDPRADA